MLEAGSLKPMSEILLRGLLPIILFCGIGIWAMWRVEQWLRSPRPALAALGPTAAIMVAEMACPPVMIVLILVFIVMEGAPILFGGEKSDMDAW